MSRAGYSDDCDADGWRTIWLYRHAVERAIEGKRGQALLRDMVAALDAMPEKRLAAGLFVSEPGECCALGAVALHRGIPRETAIDINEPEDVDGWAPPMDRDVVGSLLNIAPSLAAEVAHENDEGGDCFETDEQRWARMRSWAASHIVEAKP